MKTTQTLPHPIYLKAKAGEYLTHADRALLIRSALKNAFPLVKFSVKTQTYAGGGSVRVSWNDGPVAKDVEKVAGQFETRGFDGMIDMAHSCHLWLAPDGTATLAHDPGTQGSMGCDPEIIGSAHHPDAVIADRISSGYVFCNRHISPALYQRAIDAVKAENWAELQDFDWSKISGENFDAARSVRVYSDWLDGYICKEASKIAA